MVFTLALAAMALQGANPIGANGYDDYVQAASVLNNPMATALLAGPVRDDENLTPQASDGSNKAYLEVRRSLVGKSRLDIERLLWQKYSKAIDLVARGNTRPVSFPSEDPTAMFPEYAGFKKVAKFGVAAAHSLAADGSPRAASRILLEVLDMSANVGSNLIIGHLVGIAIQAIAIASVDENLDRFSEPDWLLFQIAAKKLLNRPSTFQAVLDSEFRMTEAALSDPGWATDLGGDSDDIAKAQKAYTSDDWVKLRTEVLAAIRRFQTSLLAVLKRPEQDWVVDESPTSNNPIVSEVVGALTPSYGSVLTAEVKARTQLRLLGMHAAIQLNRWRKGKLPEKLTDVVGSAQDPLSGREFQYEPGRRGAYELYSYGSGVTGRIDLKYIMPKTGRPDGDLEP